MRLLVFVLNRVDCLDELLAELAESGIQGGTIFNSTGMATELSHSDEYDFIFGSLRAFLDPDRAENRTILIVLKEEQVEGAMKIIRRVVGDLSQPDTGVAFTLPIDFTEGIPH